jgi:hypothetical protein
VFDQVLEQRVRKAVLVGPLGVAEDAVQGIRVGLLDAAHGLLERMADIGALGPDILPVAALRNLEAVVLGEIGQIPRRRFMCFETFSTVADKNSTHIPTSSQIKCAKCDGHLYI